MKLLPHGNVKAMFLRPQPLKGGYRINSLVPCEVVAVRFCAEIQYKPTHSASIHAASTLQAHFDYLIYTGFIIVLKTDLLDLPGCMLQTHTKGFLYYIPKI